MSDTTDHESNDKEERNKNDEQARKVKLDEEEKDENVEGVEGTLYDRFSVVIQRVWECSIFFYLVVASQFDYFYGERVILTFISV